MTEKIDPKVIEEFVNGLDIDKMEDSHTKTEILNFISKFEKERPSLSDNELIELEERLKSSSREDRISIIKDILDNFYIISDRLKSILLEYKDIIVEIKEDNQNTINEVTERIKVKISKNKFGSLK